MMLIMMFLADGVCYYHHEWNIKVRHCGLSVLKLQCLIDIYCLGW